MDRREFVRLTGGAAILGIGFATMGRRTVWAQDGTPFADLNLPELSVTMTEAGFHVSPSEATAGWTLVTFDNQLPEGNANFADLMLLPPDVTIDGVMDAVATPTAEGIPAWFYETTWAGGPIGLGGASAQGVVHLAADDWMVWSVGEPYAGAALTVTAALAATPAAPSLTADVEVAMQEFAFVGLDQAVPAGPHVWKLTNPGEHPHFMILFSGPAGTTIEQIVAALTEEEPSEDGLDLSAVAPVGGCGTLSAGLSAWHPLDLTAGSYAALCFVTDPETGAPHLMLGMGAVFTVA